MSSHMIEVLVPRYGIAWYPWAVQYFFLFGLSYACLWLATPGLIFGNKRWMPMARLAMLACVTTSVAGPVALLSDLHQPLRFWHFYAHPTPSSVMSLGSFLIIVYFMTIVGLSWLSWRPALAERAREDDGWFSTIASWLTLGQWQVSRMVMMMVGLFALLLSFGVMLYTGSEVAIVRARPLWHTAWLPVILLTTAVVGACGLVLVLNRVSRAYNLHVKQQSLNIMFLACLATGLVALAWLISGLSGMNTSVAAALDTVRDSAEWLQTAIWGSLAGGALTAATFYARLRSRVWRYAWVVGLLALHVAWTFRWVVLMNVQTIARNTGGINEYTLTFGSYGLMGIIGTFGLWIAVLFLIDLFIPWRGDELPAGEPNADSSQGVV